LRSLAIALRIEVQAHIRMMILEELRETVFR
jgi:hypothetical protein